MHVITTVGPDNATKTVIPFMAAKGAMANDEAVDLFLMGEAVYLAADSHANLDELTAPGLPSVDAVLADLREGDAINEIVVCTPCAEARGVAEDDLRAGARFGDASDLAAQAAAHETTVSF